jgi:hypothetical protein
VSAAEAAAHVSAAEAATHMTAAEAAAHMATTAAAHMATTAAAHMTASATAASESVGGRNRERECCCENCCEGEFLAHAIHPSI